MTAPEPAFGYTEFARRIQMSPNWVRHNIRTIQHIKVGRYVRFTQADVDAFLDARRVIPGSPVVPRPAGVRARRARKVS